MMGQNETCGENGEALEKTSRQITRKTERSAGGLALHDGKANGVEIRAYGWQR